MNKKITMVSAFVLASLGVFAQENDSIRNLNEVVVSDSKFALSKEKSGKVVVKITAEDLKKKQGQSLATVLSTVAGVEINGNQSRNGKDLGYYIRGGRNHQTLILIDGIPVTDASGPTLAFDMRLLPVDQVESIEILKGASSTLYGTGAAAGVINITLKKSPKKAFQGNAYMNVGSQETVDSNNNYEPNEFNQGFSIGGSVEKFNYSASLNSTFSDGISEAKPVNSASIFENDAFSRVNSVVKIGFTPTKKLSFDIFANYDRMKNEFDTGSFADDLTNFSTSEQYRVGFTPKYKYNKGEFVINSGANLINRDFFSYGTPAEYKSRSVNSDLYNKYEISTQFFVVTGAQFQFHDMSNWSPSSSIVKELAKFNMIDPYATVVYNSDLGFNLNAGARYNMHSKYGENLVFNVNPSFNFLDSKFKLLASYSTAFVTPSLYQLYSPYGRLDLTPEKDATIEAGFDANVLDKKLNINAVFFHREEKNAIGFDMTTYKYFNVEGKNKVNGFETMVSYEVNDKVKLNANYTFTELEKQSRILNPKHKANASVDFTATSRLGISVAYQFVSDRLTQYTIYDPITWTPTVINEILKDYQLVNTNLRYALIKDKFNAFLAVDNVLNKDFVEARGYSTRGRNFKIGFNFLF